MSFNFKQYVRELLIEQQTRIGAGGLSAVDGSNYAETSSGSGIFQSTTGKDPYTYSVVSHNSKQAVIKVESTSLANRQSAVGRTFKITKNNLDNPNVQLLYASLLNLGKITRITGDDASFKTGRFTAEIIAAGQGYRASDAGAHFERQHNKIKAVGHENANSVLVAEPANLSNLRGRLNTTSGSSASDIINNMMTVIEDMAKVQVVSFIIAPKMCYYMVKENSLKYASDKFETPPELTEKLHAEYVEGETDVSAQPQPTGQLTAEIIYDPSFKDDVEEDSLLTPDGKIKVGVPVPVDSGSNNEFYDKESGCWFGYDADFMKPGQMAELEKFCPHPDKEDVYTDDGGKEFAFVRFDVNNKKRPIFKSYKMGPKGNY